MRDGGFQDPPTPHQPRRFEDDARDVGGAGPSLDDADASGLPGDVARPDPLRVPESAPEWSPAELERYLHVVAMERHTADAVRRPALVDALHEHVEGVGNPNPMLLLGPSGSGKSTALATLVAEIQGGGRRAAKAGASGDPDAGAPDAAVAVASSSPASPAPADEPEPFVLAHTFGLAGQSDDFRRVLLRLCSELKTRFNIYVDLPATLDEVATAFPRFLAHAALFGKIVILLDGLDRAEARGVEADDWLPAAIPLAVRVVVASAGCRAVNALRERSGKILKILNVPPMTPAERAAAMNLALEGVGGGSADPAARVDAAADLASTLDAGDAGSPLYLLVAAREVHAFVRDARGDARAACEEARALPGILPDLINAAFDRWERRFGTSLVAEATTLVASSRAGLREDEVFDLLRATPSLVNVPASEWDALRAELEPYCWPVDRLPGEPALCFFQPQIRAAALRRYASSGAEKRQQHRRLAAHFADRRLAASHRNLQEVLFAMREGHDWDGLRFALTDPRVHATLWNEDFQIELAETWDRAMKGEQQLANERATRMVPGETPGAMVPAKPQAPLRRADYVAEYERASDLTPPSADGVLTPEVYRELLADFLAWAGHPGEAAHVLRALSEAKGDAADLAAVSVNYKLGRVLGRGGLYLEAEETLRRALAAEQLLVGAETPMVADIATELCKVKIEQGDVAQAGQLAAHAVSVWEAAEAAGYEEADVETLVRALVRLAETCEMLERTTAAEAAYERSLERLEYMLGPDHPEVAEHLGKMASAYSNHGEWEKAEFCYCRALAFAHRFTGPASVHVSHFYNVLAELHRAQGDADHAQALYQRALQVIESVVGTNHPEVATYLNNLAELLRSQGKLAEAEPMYKRALAIDEATQGVSHPIIAIRLNNLAELFRDVGREEEAEPMYQRALAIDMAALGPNHPNIATYLNNLAGLYKSREMWDKAAEHYTRAIAIDEKALGPDHPDVAIYLNNLAGLYKSRGLLTEAEPLYLRALRINEEALGADHADMAVYFNNIALLYKAQGKLVDARLYYEQAIDIGEKTLGKDHPQLATRLSNLGALLVDLEDLAAAEEAFARALEIRRRHFAEDHEDVVACEEWLRNVSQLREEEIRLGAGALPHRRRLSPLSPVRSPAPEEAEAEKSAAAAEAREKDYSGYGTRGEDVAAEEETEEPPPAPDVLPAVAAVRRATNSVSRRRRAPSAVRRSRAERGGGGFESGGRGGRVGLGEPREPRRRFAVASAAGAFFALRFGGAIFFAGGGLGRHPAHGAGDGFADGARRRRRGRGALVRGRDALAVHLRPHRARALGAEAAVDAPAAPASPPAIFMAGAAPKKDPGRADPEASREATPPAPAAGPPPPGHSSGGSPRRARDEKASDADGDLEAAPGLGEAALDAFLQAHVEYLGDRRYRCVLDGKILSKFSIMRVHVAKKFAGLVHQWAKDQAAVVAGDCEGAPANGANISPYPGRAAAPAAEPSPSPAAEPSPKPEASRRELSPAPPGALQKSPLRRLEGAQARGGTRGGTLAPARGDARRRREPLRTRAAARRGTDPNQRRRRRRHRRRRRGRRLRPRDAARVGPDEPRRAGGPNRRRRPPPLGVRRVPGGRVPRERRPGGRTRRPRGDDALFQPRRRVRVRLPGRRGAAGRLPPGDARAVLPVQRVRRVEVPERDAAERWAGVRGGGGGERAVRGDEIARRGIPRFEEEDGTPRRGAFRGSAGSSPPERRGFSARRMDFAEMLARERGPDPFRRYLPSEQFDGAALSPLAPAETASEGGAARGRRGPGRGDGETYGGGDSEDDAGAAFSFGGGTGRGETPGGLDRLGLFVAARSQQIGPRKFMCEMDGKVFSTMNLMRVHFERNYAADADAWLRKQKRREGGGAY